MACLGLYSKRMYSSLSTSSMISLKGSSYSSASKIFRLFLAEGFKTAEDLENLLMAIVQIDLAQ
jgi:hypothetical protein